VVHMAGDPPPDLPHSDEAAQGEGPQQVRGAPFRDEREGDRDPGDARCGGITEESQQIFAPSWLCPLPVTE